MLGNDERRRWPILAGAISSFDRNMIFVLVNISRKKDINEIKAEREEKFWVEKTGRFHSSGWSHKFQ